jgi:hypothetical protein
MVLFNGFLPILVFLKTTHTSKKEINLGQNVFVEQFSFSWSKNSLNASDPKVLNGVRFEVSTAVTMMIIIFWEMTPCGSYKDRRFGGSYRLHLQGARVGSYKSHTVSSPRR